MNLLLLISLFILSLVLLWAAIVLYRMRVWVSTTDRRKSGWVKFGIMDYKKNQTVPTVRLVGQPLESAIGRIRIRTMRPMPE